METTDNVIHIHHEADWSSNALVSWIDPQTRPHVVSIEAPLLWSDSPGIDLSSPPYTMPASVAVRSVRLATRGRARWEHDQVLSRPVPGRVLTPGAPHRDPCNCGNPLFHARGCPQSGTFPRIGRLAIDLKRVEGFIETMRAARTSVERIFVP
jgi:hypothetical protein